MKILLILLALSYPLRAGQMSNQMPGLLGLWHFNEGTGTRATSANSTATNAVLANTAWVTGKFGTGLYFTAANSIATITDATFNTIVSQVTLVAWIKASSNPSNAAIINKSCCATNAGPYCGYDLRWNQASTQKISFNFGTSSSVGLYVATTAAQPLNTWIHAVGVKDTMATRIYINGVLDNSAAGTGNLYHPADKPLEIGKNGWDANSFGGIIDEPAVFNRALTPGEIKNLYVTGRGVHRNGD